MSSSQKAKRFFIKGLNSNIDSIDSNLSSRFKERVVQISRIGFKGNFGVRYQMEVLPYIDQNVLQLLRAEKRWGSTADVDRIKRIETMAIHLHLLEECIKEIRDGRDRGGRIEITVRTFAQTKRNVNVKSRNFFRVYCVH